jgi:hypothetical protein
MDGSNGRCTAVTDRSTQLPWSRFENDCSKPSVVQLDPHFDFVRYFTDFSFHPVTQAAGRSLKPERSQKLG